VLDELKERLSAAYGERLHAVVLFGSEARGDARPDSDIDVLVVLETLTGDYGEELERGDSPLLREVRRSGVAA
jgi:predicted nucleotidyltransferase